MENKELVTESYGHLDKITIRMPFGYCSIISLFNSIKEHFINKYNLKFINLSVNTINDIHLLDRYVHPIHEKIMTIYEIKKLFGSKEWSNLSNLNHSYFSDIVMCTAIAKSILSILESGKIIVQFIDRTGSNKIDIPSVYWLRSGYDFLLSPYNYITYQDERTMFLPEIITGSLVVEKLAIDKFLGDLTELYNFQNNNILTKKVIHFQGFARNKMHQLIERTICKLGTFDEDEIWEHLVKLSTGKESFFRIFENKKIIWTLKAATTISGSEKELSRENFDRFVRD